MRQDQYDKLQTLSEQLLDVFLVEAEPSTWPGAGVPAANMDKSTRGARVWTKRDAAATLAVVQRISTLITVVRNKTAAGSAEPEAVVEAEQDLETEIASAEHEAARLMSRITSRRGKA